MYWEWLDHGLFIGVTAHRVFAAPSPRKSSLTTEKRVAVGEIAALQLGKLSSNVGWPFNPCLVESFAPERRPKYATVLRSILVCLTSNLQKVGGLRDKVESSCTLKQEGRCFKNQQYDSMVKLTIDPWRAGLWLVGSYVLNSSPMEVRCST